jgi:hypothetical protein
MLIPPLVDEGLSDIEIANRMGWIRWHSSRQVLTTENQSEAKNLQPRANRSFDKPSLINFIDVPQ